MGHNFGCEPWFHVVSDGDRANTITDSESLTFICSEKLFSFVLCDIFATVIILGCEPWFRVVSDGDRAKTITDPESPTFICSEKLFSFVLCDIFAGFKI